MGKKKEKSQKYTEQDLLSAVNAVRHGGLSFRKASGKYGVPVMTIQNRVSGKIEDTAYPGRPTVLPIEIEQKLAEKIKTAALQGFGLTRRMLAVRVARLCRKMQIKTPFKNGVPGKDWLAGFIKRHPDLSIRSPTALSTVRARMLNPTVTENYFSELRFTLSRLSLTNSPAVIWNIDETSVPLLHKPAKVIAGKGVKNIPGRVGNNRDNVSVLACINAAGMEIPPMVIVKGKTYKSLNAYNTTEGVPGSKYTYQERAWMEDALGEIWFKEHFLKHCGEARPQIIIMDSHSSHETLGLIDAARENDITLLTFPPHTTQWLCPLDKSVFGPLSREFSRVCTEFMSDDPNNMVSKWEWPRLFRKAHDLAFTPSNIISGFKKCGIFPTDSKAVPQQAFAPSAPFDTGPINTVSNISNQVESLFVTNETAVTEMPNTNNTTESYESITENQLLEAVLSGEINCSQDSSGVINIQLPIMDSATVNEEPITEGGIADLLVPSWSEEISNIFSLNVVDKKESKASKRLTSHRLLTSDDIFNQKRLEFQKRQMEIDAKLKRKLEREAKKLENEKVNQVHVTGKKKSKQEV